MLNRMVLFIIIICSLASTGAEARRGRRGFVGGYNSWQWRNGHWNHGAFFDHYGWWWAAGPYWYFYSEPVYPYPSGETEPAYFVQVSTMPPPPMQPGATIKTQGLEVASPSESPQHSEGKKAYTYYCEREKTYYPVTEKCGDGWIATEVNPPVPTESTKTSNQNAVAATNAPVTQISPGTPGPPSAQINQFATNPQAGPPGSADAPPPTQPKSTGFFYFCAKANAYFPATPTCPDNWIAVPVTDPVLITDWGRPYVPADSKKAVTLRPNTVSLELFGRAAIYSFNFDRALSSHFTLGIGVSNWDLRDRWDDYNASVTVVPVYANYYFSENPSRGYVSIGADWIQVSHNGFSNDTFTNNGVAGTVGGGYENRSDGGFMFRLGGYAIIGRSLSVEPSCSFGYSF